MDIVEEAARLGYDAIAITDHNTVNGSLEAKALKFPNMRVIVSAEFSTQAGHVLAYDIDESIELRTKRIDGKRYDFQSLIGEVRRVGGIAVLAHPYNSRIKEHGEWMALLDGIEVYNSRLDSFIWAKKSKIFQQGMAGVGGGIRIGGPDAHNLDELKNCYLDVEGDSDEALSALLSRPGRIYAAGRINRSIARAEYENRKHFSIKKWFKYVVRYGYGLLEEILKENEYELVYDGKKYESIHKEL